VRPARALLAHYGEERLPVHAVPRVSQELLAEIVGTTRSRVNFFMNKFRKLGLSEYNGTFEGSSATVFVVSNGTPKAPAAPRGNHVWGASGPVR